MKGQSRQYLLQSLQKITDYINYVYMNYGHIPGGAEVGVGLGVEMGSDEDDETSTSDEVTTGVDVVTAVDSTTSDVAEETINEL